LIRGTGRSRTRTARTRRRWVAPMFAQHPLAGKVVCPQLVPARSRPDDDSARVIATMGVLRVTKVVSCPWVVSLRAMSQYMGGTYIFCMASAFVLAAASMAALSLRSLSFNPNLPSQRANPLQAGERILLNPFDGIVPSVFSSNIIDNATRQRASSIQHWNFHSGSAGLAALLLRSRSLSGGFRTHIAT
jgi:hypothetical protein